jgi:hypothetical protein
MTKERTDQSHGRLSASSLFNTSWRHTCTLRVAQNACIRTRACAPSDCSALQYSPRAVHHEGYGAHIYSAGGSDRPWATAVSRQHELSCRGFPVCFRAHPLRMQRLLTRDGTGSFHPRSGRRSSGRHASTAGPRAARSPSPPVGSESSLRASDCNPSPSLGCGSSCPSSIF